MTKMSVSQIDMHHVDLWRRVCLTSLHWEATRLCVVPSTDKPWVSARGGFVPPMIKLVHGLLTPNDALHILKMNRSQASLASFHAPGLLGSGAFICLFCLSRPAYKMADSSRYSCQQPLRLREFSVIFATISIPSSLQFLPSSSRFSFTGLFVSALVI